MSKSQVGLPRESEANYCLGMAKKLICGDFERPVDIFYNTRDGHICCSDGRHRICVAQKLNSTDKAKKLAVKVNLMVE